MDSKELRGLMEAYSEVYAHEKLDEDSRRMSNKQRTARVRSNIKSFGSNFTPPNNYDPDANRGKGEVLTRKQIEKKRRKALRQEEFDIFDEVLEFLQVEGYAETLEEAEWMMANLIDEEAIAIITELTGGKGHPGYKAGSKDHGPMQSGHPADTFKRRMKGGTMSQRHGDHLGDLDDKDDDEDDLEAGLKDTARKKRENVRKPLRDKVKAARKKMAKEEYVDEADSIAAMRERAAKRREQRYGKSGGGGRDDFRPYTKADYDRGEKKK